MKLDATTIWALSATAIAIMLAGVMIGKSLPPAQTQNVTTQSPPTSEPGGQPLVDEYRVPDWLVDAPTEWRSESVKSEQSYAILFDYNRRELLVEQCSHSGYFDLEANRPIDQPGFGCSRVLTGKLLKFTENGVLAQSRDGSDIEIELEAIQPDSHALLELRFANHSMQLIPGQTNDLAQEIEATTKIKAEAKHLFEFEQQQKRQQRALMSANKEGVPQLALPADVPNDNDRDRILNH